MESPVVESDASNSSSDDCTRSLDSVEAGSDVDGTDDVAELAVDVDSSPAGTEDDVEDVVDASPSGAELSPRSVVDLSPRSVVELVGDDSVSPTVVGGSSAAGSVGSSADADRPPSMVVADVRMNAVADSQVPATVRRPMMSYSKPRGQADASVHVDARRSLVALSVALEPVRAQRSDRTVARASGHMDRAQPGIANCQRVTATPRNSGLPVNHDSYPTTR